MSLDRALWADLIGKPFRFRGRGPEYYDCYGLVMELYRRRGIIVHDAAYTVDDGSQQQGFLGGIASGAWHPAAIQPGVTLGFRRHGVIQHCGMAIDDDRFIHASEDHGSVLVSRLSRGLPAYRQNLMGAYDYAV